jgi:TolB protein
MAERLGTPIRGLRTFLISTLGWLISLPKRLFQRLWSGLTGVAFWLANTLGTAGRAPDLLWDRVLQRSLHFVFLSVSVFASWFFVDLLWDGLKALPALAGRAGRAILTLISGIVLRVERIVPGRRTRIEERLLDFGSRQLPGKRSVRLTGALEPVSSKVRVSRFTTAVVTTGILLFLGVLTTQGRPTGQVAALDEISPTRRPAVAPLVPKMTLTPTTAPTPTPEPTPVPTIAPTIAADFSPWPTPDPLGSSGTIAFTARENGHSDIYALTVGRSDPIQLTHHAADDRAPAWSPDGQQLAFASHRDGNWEIYILDLPTGFLRRLTDNADFDGHPSWSPDGQWLVYESYRQQNMDLFILDVAGDNPPIRVTEDPALDFAPSWSPDGRHIAYTSWRSGNKDIFIMSLDTASDEAALNVTISPDRHEDRAGFAADGRFLAYYSDGDGLDLIYALPLENYRPAGAAFSLGRGHHPSWSPDGTSLAYVIGKEDRSYIVAGSIDSWSVVPQAYNRDGIVHDLNWSGLVLPRGVASRYSIEDEEIEPIFVEQVDPPQEFGPSFLLREIDVEAPSPYLSDKVDDSFTALREQVGTQVGWDFLGQVDNVFSFLTARPFPGEPDQSWNKAARAFDFYYRYPISIEPQVEIVREDLGADTYWRVYLRAADQDGTVGEPLRQLPWDFTARYEAEPRYYDQGGKLKESIPAGYYLDFTAMAADYGWTRTPALANWRTFFQGIRYWHFENRQGLLWEEAILELYTNDELEQVYDNR